MTKAEYTRRVGDILLTVTTEIKSLSEGMWNPDFCSSDANSDAKDFCADVRKRLAYIDKRRRFSSKEQHDG